MRIKSITKIEKPETVYNLHIKNNHNYVANNLVVSNCHVATASVLQTMLSGPFAKIPIRWGLSGTVPSEEHSATSILATIGPTVNSLAASDLMKIGVLAKCYVKIIQLMDTVEYSNYPEEYTYLVTDSNRLDWISQLIIDQSQTGNTLILVNRIETGKALETRIKDSVFVSGRTKSSDRKDSYNEMRSNDNKVIIATYGVAAVGLDIPRIFNLVLVEPGKSFVRVIQSIGRSIRIAKDKNEARIFDLASTCKFSTKHVSARKKIYKHAQYPFSVEKIDYIDQLAKGKIVLKENPC
jgi:superfamily II DNA or RNA helicase